MALHTKNKEIEEHPSPLSRRARLEVLLRSRIWPEIPAELRGKPLTKEEKEKTLGYGPEGH
jgi:hypothetical protein